RISSVVFDALSVGIAVEIVTPRAASRFHVAIGSVFLRRRQVWSPPRLIRFRWLRLMFGYRRRWRRQAPRLIARVPVADLGADVIAATLPGATVCVFTAH